LSYSDEMLVCWIVIGTLVLPRMKVESFADWKSIFCCGGRATNGSSCRRITKKEFRVANLKRTAGMGT